MVELCSIRYLSPGQIVNFWKSCRHASDATFTARTPCLMDLAKLLSDSNFITTS